MSHEMKQRYRVFRRGWGYYCEDLLTKKEESLKTRDKAEAFRLVAAKNETEQAPAFSLHLARVYWKAGDPAAASRTWRHVIAELHEKHRAKLFRRRCLGLGIEGVSLHSYRYAWAERAKKAGYPERFAQEALGHNSAAVHRAYAKKAEVILPPLEEYERRIVRLDKEIIKAATVLPQEQGMSAQLVKP